MIDVTPGAALNCRRSSSTMVDVRGLVPGSITSRAERYSFAANPTSRVCPATTQRWKKKAAAGNTTVTATCATITAVHTPPKR